jgi:Fur family transcriptional regulator, peroxide stress response regulator
MDKFARYQEAFKGAGLRMTGPRLVICTYLASTEHHPTPYQVYEEISAEHPEISRATVYNTLNTLQQLGVIVELSIGADHTHYDTNPEPHVNLICLRCHRIQDFGDAPSLEGLEGAASSVTGFCPLVARVDVLGVCALCQANSIARHSHPILHPQRDAE